MSVRSTAAYLALLGGALATFASCKGSLDSLGCIELKLDGGDGSDAGVTLGRLLGPASYPNAFRDLLGKTESEIAAKIADTYNQLFRGDPADEAIFFPVGTDQAYILDVLHDQVRTEGIGLGMLITVQLDKRDDFDRLWRYTQAVLQIPSGPARGYLPSYCNDPNGDFVCNDPFGMQQIATALLLARGRWQASPGTIDYGREAVALLDVIRNKEIHNCGVSDGVTAVFDVGRKLPYDTPTAASAKVSRPSIVMPASYDLWFQATGDPFWSDAAAAARAYWQATAHPTTGLIPEKATFDGKPVPGFDRFAPECDRALINMAIDRLWSGNQPWVVDEANRVLRFFYGRGLTTYGQIYSLDGTQELASLHDMPLVAANGVLALVADFDRRADFVNEVWILDAPTGKPRYYSSILHLLALVILSGQMRVY